MNLPFSTAQLRAAPAVLLLFGGLVGCTGGATVSTNDTGGDASGDTTVEPDDDAGGTADAGTVDVSPPDDEDTGGEDRPEKISAALEITFEPSLSTYAPGVSLQGSVRVFDSEGNTVDNPNVDWSANPDDIASHKGGGTVELKAEGKALVEACAEIPSGQEVCGSKDVVVDSGPPTLEVESPSPGALLGSGNQSTIEVSGRARDGSDSVRVYVNGKRARPDDQGRFSVQIEPDFGINPVRVVATDGLHQSEATERFDVLWSNHWTEVSTEQGGLGFSIGDGIGLDLGQQFFDDGEGPDRRPSDATVVASDIADIFGLLISNLDVGSAIDNPVFDSGDTSLSIRGVQLGDPTVLSDVTNSGAQIFVHIPSLVLQTGGEASIEGKTLDLDGNISGAISAFVDVGITRSNGEFQTSVQSLEVSIDSISPSFTDDEADALFNLAESALRAEVEDRVSRLVENEIVASLPTILSETLLSLESGLSNQTFEFESPLTGETRSIQFDGNISTFETVRRRSLRALLTTDFRTDSTDIYPSAPGVPRMGPQGRDLPFYDQGYIQVGVRLGLLNGIAMSLWKTSFFEGDVTDQVPDSFSSTVQEAVVSGKLPPVIRPSREEETTDFVLELGQFEASLSALGQTDTFGVNIEAGVDIAIDGTTLSLETPGTPEFDVWLIETTGDSAVISAEDIRGLLRGQIWPDLRKSIQNGLKFELPMPDTSRVSDLAPALQRMNLEIGLARPVSARDGAAVFDTQLRGTLPLN